MVYAKIATDKHFLIARNVHTKNTVDLSTAIAAEATVISVSEVSAIILFSRGYGLIRAVPLFHLKSQQINTFIRASICPTFLFAALCE